MFRAVLFDLDGTLLDRESASGVASPISSLGIPVNCPVSAKPNMSNVSEVSISVDMSRRPRSTNNSG